MLKGNDTLSEASSCVSAVVEQRPMHEIAVIDGHSLTIEQTARISYQHTPIQLTDNAETLRRVQASCDYITNALDQGLGIYGVTTGFGGAAKVQIDPEEIGDLQHNLLWFLKAGVGGYLPVADVRAAMVLRLNSLIRGDSAIRLELLQRFVTFLNHGVTPRVREHGSIGASGDLVPLASIAGALLGQDRSFLVDFNGETVDAISALERLQLAPITLRPKEGLALVNGTSVMTGVAANCVHNARFLIGLTLHAHALLLQGLAGTNQAFHPFIHQRKPLPGQYWVAQQMLALLSGSGLIHDEMHGRHQKAEGRAIQDRYSQRCLPQFIGPVVEGIGQIARQIEIEMNSSNDNPLIDSENGGCYHGGNFLGQYIGIGMDQLRSYIGLLAKHLDAQIALLVAPEFNGGLAHSLAGNPARSVNMGLKGLQISGNALMPMLSFLGTPLVDRFATHAEQFNQNINSLGYGAANLARQSIELFQSYLAITLMFGIQAVDLRTYQRAGHYDSRKYLSPATVPLYEAVYAAVGSQPSSQRPYIRDDRDQSLETHIVHLTSDIRSDGLIRQAMRDTPAIFETGE